MFEKKLLLLSWIFIVSEVGANEPNIEGVYSSGSSLYVMPNHNFAIIDYGTALAGKYEIKEGIVSFQVSDLGIPVNYIEEFKELSADSLSDIQKPNDDQMIIQFDPDLSDDLYIGINQSTDHPKLKRILNSNANCFEYSNMNVTVDREKENTIILYGKKTEYNPEFSRKYIIPKNINRLQIRYNTYGKYFGKVFKAKIQKDGLLFLSEYEAEGKFAAREPLSENSKENLEFANEIIDQYAKMIKDKDKIFFSSTQVALNDISFDEEPLIKMECEPFDTPSEE